jgi:hypothetical protein
MNPLYSAYGYYLYDGTRNNSGNRYIMISDHFAKLLRGDLSKPTAAGLQILGEQRCIEQ